MSFASTAERAPDTATTHGQQGRGPDRRGDDPARHPGVEAAEAELRRDDHQPEEQRERRHVDRRPRRGRRHPLGRDQRERAEERDAGAVEREAGDLAQQHPEVDDREDDEDERVQAASPSGARSRRSPSSSVASSLQKAKRTRWRTRSSAANALHRDRGDADALDQRAAERLVVVVAERADVGEREVGALGRPDAEAHVGEAVAQPVAARAVVGAQPRVVRVGRRERRRRPRAGRASRPRT